MPKGCATLADALTRLSTPPRTGCLCVISNRAAENGQTMSHCQHLQLQHSASSSFLTSFQTTYTLAYNLYSNTSQPTTTATRNRKQTHVSTSLFCGGVQATATVRVCVSGCDGTFFVSTAIATHLSCLTLRAYGE